MFNTSFINQYPNILSATRHFKEKCSNCNINFEADIRSNTLGYLPSEDYTSIFCNLLDNAIESAIHCNEPYIDCNVSLIRGGNADLISIANSCKSSPLGHDGKLHSRKQEFRVVVMLEHPL